MVVALYLKYPFKKNNDGAVLIAVSTRQVELLYNKIAVYQHFIQSTGFLIHIA
jgi:hypothetical protein